MRDLFLQRIIEWIKINKWSNCSVEERPYKSHRQILCVDDGVILKGTVPAILECLRNKVLDSAHSTHCGTTATKLLLKLEAWWPGFASDVERWVRDCPICCGIKPKIPKDLDKWPAESKAWERVHMDHALAPHVGLFLILVDAFSGWPEVIKVQNRSSSATIDAVRTVFSRNGVPFHLVTDNAQEFCSDEFLKWLTMIGCTPYKTPPYHPQSNGCAERMVRTVKESMKAWKEEFGRYPAYLQKVLMNYRSIPHGNRKESCSKRMGRQIRSPVLCSSHFKPMEKVFYEKKDC